MGPTSSVEGSCADIRLASAADFLFFYSRLCRPRDGVKGIRGATTVARVARGSSTVVGVHPARNMPATEDRVPIARHTRVAHRRATARASGTARPRRGDEEPPTAHHATDEPGGRRGRPLPAIRVRGGSSGPRPWPPATHEHGRRRRSLHRSQRGGDRT